MHRALAIGVAALVLGCEPAPSGEASSTSASNAEPRRVTRAEDVNPIRVPGSPSPAALDRIVKAAPSAGPPSTRPDGATKVGQDTGVAAPDEEPAPPQPPPPKVEAGGLEVRPQLSSPAIEREARAQIYWRLRRCKGPDGRPPPPESITLSFTIRGDGTVDPVSATALARDESLQPAADCVLREFSNVPFEGPVATRRTTSRIIITWPSVD